ncbi:hypothetical protein [Anaerotignum sp.]
MKWSKAIAQIEEALAAGKDVEIRYHRKWMLQDAHCDKVYSVPEYEYNGQICKAVDTYCDGIDEGSHIIDAVIIEEKSYVNYFEKDGKYFAQAMNWWATGGYHVAQTPKRISKAYYERMTSEKEGE